MGLSDLLNAAPDWYAVGGCMVPYPLSAVEAMSASTREALGPWYRWRKGRAGTVYRAKRWVTIPPPDYVLWQP